MLAELDCKKRNKPCNPTRRPSIRTACFSSPVPGRTCSQLCQTIAALYDTTDREKFQCQRFISICYFLNIRFYCFYLIRCRYNIELTYQSRDSELVVAKLKTHIRTHTHWIIQTRVFRAPLSSVHDIMLLMYKRPSCWSRGHKMTGTRSSVP